MCVCSLPTSYLEPLGAVQPSQSISEGHCFWKLTRSWTQLLAGYVQLFFLQRHRLVITDSGEVSQVPRHGSRGTRPTSAHFRGKNMEVWISIQSCNPSFSFLNCSGDKDQLFQLS